MLLILDEKLFHLLNKSFVCGFLDFLMPIMSDRTGWMIILLGILGIFVWKGGRRGRIMVIGLLVAVAITDPLAAKVLKPLIGRIRPCHALSDSVRLLWNCGGMFSFPSNHAANTAAMATTFGMFYPKSLWFGVPIALLVGFSRIYLGVHYPLDILGGFILGAVLGLLSALLMMRIFRKVRSSK